MFRYFVVTMFVVCSFSGIAQDTWEVSFKPPQGFLFRAIKVVDANVVWAMAQTSLFTYSVVRTTDGGNFWEVAAGTGFPTDYRIRAITALDANTAYIGTWAEVDYDASAYRTTDGGATWEQAALTGITDFINFTHVFDAQEAIAVGDPITDTWGIAKTTDGGATWNAIQSPPSGSGEVGVGESYDFVGDFGWFGTVNSKVYQTTDRGDTWTDLSLPNNNVGMISLRDKHTGIIRFYNDNTTGGTNMYAITTDAGATWKEARPIPTENFGFVLMEPGGAKTWVCNTTTIHLTKDNGITWAEETVSDPAPGIAPGVLSLADVYTDDVMTYVWAAGTEIYKRTGPFDEVVSTEPPSIVGDFNMNVYPNPVQSGSNVGIELSGVKDFTADIVLYDAYGREVRRQIASTNGTVLVSTQGLPSGTYYATLRQGTDVKTVPVLVVQ